MVLRLLTLSCWLLTSGCHLLFPFEVPGPGQQGDQTVADIRTDGAPGERPPDLVAPYDGSRPDAAPSDAEVPDTAAADLKPPLDLKVGPAWSPMTSGVSSGLYSVWGHSASSVFAVGGSGTVLFYNGTGVGWKKLTPVTTEQLFGVTGTGTPGQVYVVGRGGAVAECNATGCTLKTFIWPGGVPELTGATCVSTQNCFLSGYNKAMSRGEVYLLQKGSSVFKQHGGSSTGRLFGIWSHYVPLRVYAVGEEGTIARSAGSFSEKFLFPPVNLTAVWGVAPDDIFVVGEAATFTGHPLEATLLRRVSGSWTKIPTGTATGLHGVWGSGPGDVWAVGLKGRILHYNGTKVSQHAGSKTGAGTTALWAVWGAGVNDVFVVGNSGMILRYH